MEDVLADVLERTRLGGAVSARLVLRTPWGLRFPVARRAGFHAVVRGACTLHVEGEPKRVLHQGDIVLLPHGSAHTLTSQPRGTLSTVPELVRHAKRFATEGIVDGGGDGPEAELVCGVYHFESDETHPVLAHLPTIVHVPGGAHQSSEIQAALQLLALEVGQGQAGGRTIVTRLVDVLFVLVVRAWMRTDGARSVGWLGALGDPQIGRALALMHRSIHERPSVETLARAARMSRATFHRRFVKLVGVSPRDYLIGLSVQQAARLLRTTELSLAEIAQRTGYESEHSLSKAFRRVMGVAPGRYRERARDRHAA